MTSAQAHPASVRAGSPASDTPRRAGPPATAIIVGGGIAGIACALHLAEAGVKVTLLETRKKLGGRATSFTDVRTGMVIDNCQHVALGCCTNYLDFCRRLGVLDKITWLREIHWVEAGGRVSTMRPGMLPAPGHFTGSFLGASFLTAFEKAAIARAMHAAIHADRSLWATRTFADWLGAHMQPASTLTKFWEPVIVSACNLGAAQVCAASALHVFQEGFLAHRDSAAIGVARVPLVELYDPAEAAIERAGGVMRLGTGVEAVWPDRVRTTGGETLSADAVVCAVPVERAVRIVDASVQAIDPRFAAMPRITHSPILGVHLAFDRPVMPMHSATLVARPTQWIFRKDEAGKHVHAVISGADEWMPLSEDEITRRVMQDMHACFPASRQAKLESSRPVKEKLATFAPTPDVEAARPSQTGPSGLVLAGDYTRTGWPATMEGAVRSGALAAGALLGKPPRDMLASPLAPGLVVRTIAPRLARAMRA